MSSLSIEGPCLIHSMNGDLLRTLEGPERCLRPRLIQSSTEGHCIIYYDKGQFCFFSVNGKLLGHVEVEDSIRVRKCIREPAYERETERESAYAYVCVCAASA